MWSIDLLPSVLALGALLVPIGLLLALLALRRRREQASELCSPMAAHRKLLRGPGESLRREGERLDDQLNEALLGICIGPLALVAVAAVTALRSPRPLGWIEWITWGVAGAVGFTFAYRHVLRLHIKRRRVRLGFSGERAVGEELNGLMREGWRVFHDVPADQFGNVDHVLVGPGGVYAVETKTRRKRREKEPKIAVASQRGEAHRLFYDGERIYLGTASANGGDSRALEQARRQARWLGDFLAKATGEPVPVRPILTFPGWFIDRRGRGEVLVVNPAEMRGALDRVPVLGPAQITRICYQLDARCRDVEF